MSIWSHTEECDIDTRNERRVCFFEEFRALPSFRIYYGIQSPGTLDSCLRRNDRNQKRRNPNNLSFTYTSLFHQVTQEFFSQLSLIGVRMIDSYNSLIEKCKSDFRPYCFRDVFKMSLDIRIEYIER